MYFQKTEILKGRGGSQLWNSEGIGGGGGNAFWNFRRQGGVKTWKPSVVGYGYFLELPNDSKRTSKAMAVSEEKLDEGPILRALKYTCISQ